MASHIVGGKAAAHSTFQNFYRVLWADKSVYARLCILSGEITITTKEISLAVFFCWQRFYERLPPGGSCREATEGECDTMKIAKT